jgi:hypothetical protein
MTGLFSKVFLGASLLAVPPKTTDAPTLPSRWAVLSCCIWSLVNMVPWSH